jgi:hypothetical protein
MSKEQEEFLEKHQQDIVETIIPWPRTHLIVAPKENEVLLAKKAKRWLPAVKSGLALTGLPADTTPIGACVQIQDTYTVYLLTWSGWVKYYDLQNNKELC